jgi:hypothetical protein
MPGPVPKPPELRQRRNKTSTRATLVVLETKRKERPELPAGDWSVLTKRWWTNVWASPMAEEYLEADHHGLILLAHLIEQYWRDPKVTLAAEIRAQEARFGLSPIDRRRLQGEVKRVEGNGKKPGGRNIRPRSRDPREILRQDVS